MPAGAIDGVVVEIAQDHEVRIAFQSATAALVIA